MSPTKRRAERLGAGGHYLRGLGLSTRNNAVAYGYTIAITVAFAALVRLRAEPTIAELFLFVGGAGLAFAGVNALVTRGFRDEPPDEPAVVTAFGTSLSAISIAIALGIACLIGWGVRAWPCWPLASFAATLAYLLSVAGEMAFAGARHEHGGPGQGGR